MIGEGQLTSKSSLIPMYYFQKPAAIKAPLTILPVFAGWCSHKVMLGCLQDFVGIFKKS